MKNKSLLGRLVRFADPTSIATCDPWISGHVALAVFAAFGLVVEEITRGSITYCRVQWVNKRWRDIFEEAKSNVFDTSMNFNLIAREELTDDMTDFEC